MGYKICGEEMVQGSMWDMGQFDSKEVCEEEIVQGSMCDMGQGWDM